MTETEALASYKRLKSLKDKDFAGTKILATTMQDISNVIQYVAKLKKITTITELKFNSKDKATTEKVIILYNNIEKLKLSDLIKNKPEKNKKILKSTIKELIDIVIYAYDNRDEDKNFYLHNSEEGILIEWRLFYNLEPGEEATDDTGNPYGPIIDLTVEKNESLRIKGTMGSSNGVKNGNYTGIQTESAYNLSEYKKLYFTGSVTPTFNLGDQHNVFIRLKNDRIVNTFYAGDLINAYDAENNRYMIDIPTFSREEGQTLENIYISFFVANSNNGNSDPEIKIDKLWLEPKEG